MKRTPFKTFELVAALGVLLACSHSAVLDKTSASRAASAPIFANDERPRTDKVEATGAKVSIATQGRFSTDAAHEILAQGGNLIDAAVASSFVLAVERPHSTGLTGGGFLLYREGKSGSVYAVDFRERAPQKSTEKMFLAANGQPDKNLSQNSILASGVPGLVAGLVEIHQRFGKLPLSKVIKPAIALAENGFPVYPSLAKALTARSEILQSQPYAKALFTSPTGKVLQVGELLVQKDLAQTLRQISKQGRAGFYKGPVAKKFLAYVQKNHGLITAADFAAYKVHWREPVRGSFKGYEILSMPPPSSGGVHVIQFLKFLEEDALKNSGFLSAPAIHLAAASLQSAFADRAQYVGDPDFVKVPVKGLTSKKYLEARRKEVSLEHARTVSEVQPGKPLPYESSETTHFSMMDAEGNMVSSTQTINGWMGSGLVVPGTGLVLNNEMDDFSAKPGSQNLYDAVGGSANSIQPRKTPLSSMAPTLVLKNGVPLLAVGAPGGTRIISCVAQTILNVLEFQLPLYESIASIRYHHQWQPDTLQIDPPGASAETMEELKRKGYKVEVKPIGCTVMAVSRETADGAAPVFRAVADPRDIGTSYAE
jgi:gamma-glutamyltranspeptidase/glutathione hydrolase